MPMEYRDQLGIHSPYAVIHLLRAVNQLDCLLQEVIDGIRDRYQLERKRGDILGDLAEELGYPESRFYAVMSQVANDPVAGESDGPSGGGRHSK